MTTAPQRILDKYNWAKTHVDNLESAIGDFRSENRHAIRREDDLQKGEASFYVESVPAIPVEIPLRLSDAIHNLRSTLDHLVHAVVAKAEGTIDENTGFPISKTSKDFKSVLMSRIKGARQECYKVIERIEPYPSGTGRWAWELHYLDILEKHKLLPTISTVPTGRTMMPSEKAFFSARKSLIGPHGFAAIQLANAASNPPVVPMKAGYKLGTFPVSEVDEDMGFSFHIAINEPEIVPLIPSLILMRGYAGAVLRVITDLAVFI